MKELYENLRNLNKKGIFIEVGAGMPVYNYMCLQPGTSSKIVLYAESPFNWELNQSLYDHANVRAISPEVCRNIIRTYEKRNDLKHADFIYVNTFQIGDANTIQTHGWIAYKDITGNTKYYHVSINKEHVVKNRTALQEEINNISLEIMVSQNNVSKLSYHATQYIDIILDDKLNNATEDICICYTKFNVHNILAANNTTIFTTNNKIIRLNEYLRNKDHILIFKGSFNPMHIQHKNILNNALEVTKTQNKLLCISINNRDINKIITSDNLMYRITELNNQGYDVMVDKYGYYHDNLRLIQSNAQYKSNPVKISYVLGGDILNRLIEDEKQSEKSFEEKYTCDFYYAERPGYEIPELIHNNIYKLNVELSDISSSKIREEQTQ